MTGPIISPGVASRTCCAVPLAIYSAGPIPAERPPRLARFGRPRGMMAIELDQSAAMRARAAGLSWTEPLIGMKPLPRSNSRGVAFGRRLARLHRLGKSHQHRAFLRRV